MYGNVAAWVLFGLPVVTAAIVNRWWALSIAFVPAIVQWYLHTATDYVYPYHEDPYPVIVFYGSAFLLVLAVAGLGLRRLWDQAPRLRCRSGQHSG